MILAIETATEVCSAALVDRDTVLALRSLHEKNIHSERLLSLIDELFAETKKPLSSIDGIAVSFGPGSFTGLRIGLSAAKGLALALNLPLLAVPTLDGIAEAFRMSGRSGPFCAMIGAKREEAFYAFYRISASEIEREGEFAITMKTEILTAAEQKNAVVDQPVITASAVGLLAERRRQYFLLSDFSTAEPLYLRDFVATLPKNKG
jgi:tRNA threonylcarbamoyladenosine biosynthesis protein TsaB